MRKRKKWALGLAIVGLCVEARVEAQTAPEAPSADKADGLEEIVVVAQKRNESLQNVPAAVTAYSGKTLENLGVTSSADVARQTVSMVWTTGFGYTSPRVYIRGVGTSQFYSLVQTPVGVYLDGAIVGNNIIQGFQIFDLERVETLRGPQGSLYGRNTTGGLVNYITRQPKIGGSPEAYVIASAGDYGLLEAQGAVGVPLGERAALRVSGNYRYRDGLQENVNPATSFGRLGKTDVGAMRATLAFEPDAATRANLSVRYGINRSELKPSKNIGLKCPPGVTPGIGSTCTDLFGFRETADFTETSVDLKTREETDQIGTTAQFEHDFPGVTLTSITAYDDASRTVLEDTDSSPNPLLHTSYFTKAKMFSQELRATSRGPGPFKWVGGLYFYTDKVDQWFGATTVALGRGFFFPPARVVQGVGSQFGQTTTTGAVFGDVSYALTNALKLTVGARITYDRRKVSGEAFVYDATGLGFSYISPALGQTRKLYNTIPQQTVDNEWSDLSGRVVLDYKASPDILLYGSFATGFRGGEFNGGALFNPAQANLSNPEKIYAFEIGAKTEWLNGKLRINGSAFYYDYQDRQVFVQDSDGAVTVNKLLNAASSRTIGFDLETAFQPTRQLLFNLNVGILDAQFRGFRPEPGVDFTGNTIEHSPKFTLTTLARYEQPLGAVSAYLQADARYQSRVYFGAENDPLQSQDSYWLVGARTGIMTSDERYELAIWVKNMFDERYLIEGSTNEAFLFDTGIVGDQRTFGATVTARF